MKNFVRLPSTRRFATKRHGDPDAGSGPSPRLQSYAGPSPDEKERVHKRTWPDVIENAGSRKRHESRHLNAISSLVRGEKRDLMVFHPRGSGRRSFITETKAPVPITLCGGFAANWPSDVQSLAIDAENATTSSLISMRETYPSSSGGNLISSDSGSWPDLSCTGGGESSTFINRHFTSQSQPYSVARKNVRTIGRMPCTIIRQTGTLVECPRDVGRDIVFDGVEPFDTRGHFCDMFLGTHSKVGKVALKRLRHQSGGEGDTETLNRHFERETNIWIRLRHPRILPCLGTFTRERHLYLVSPFMKNGTMLDWLRSERRGGPERLRLICELADAIAYLHSRGIVHGDIKANNVLISDDFHVQLCDFGLTKLAESCTTTTLKGAESIRWQSPELWNNEPKTFSSDVYAFAMTVVEVLTGQVPFADMVHDSAVILAVHLKGERLGRSPETSVDGTSYTNSWDVTQKCWHNEAGQRISIEQVVGLLDRNVPGPSSARATPSSIITATTDQWDVEMPSGERQLPKALAVWDDVPIDSSWPSVPCQFLP